MNSYTVFLILIVIVAFLLVAVIMVQNPKGGGLASSFGGSGTQQLGGVKQTTDFLDKSTWYLAITLIVLILLSNVTFNKNEGDLESKALDSQEIVDEQVPLNLPKDNESEDINLENE
jgi:preprotein translocase subunit SecG